MRIQPKHSIGKSGRVILVIVVLAVVGLLYLALNPETGLLPGSTEDETPTRFVRSSPELVTLPGVETFPGIAPDEGANANSEIEVPSELLEVAEFIQPDPNAEDDAEPSIVDDLFVSKYIANSTEQEVTNWYIEKINSAGYTIASPYGEAAILNVTSPDGKKYAVDIEEESEGNVSVLVATQNP